MLAAAASGYCYKRHNVDSKFTHSTGVVALSSVFWWVTWPPPSLVFLRPLFTRANMRRFLMRKEVEYRQMERVYQRYSEPSHYHTIAHTGTLEKANSITAPEVFLAVKSLKAWKTAACDEIRHEMLKTSNIERVLCLTRVRQVACCSGKAPKDGKLGWSSPHTIRKTGKNALTTRTSLFLAKCLEKNAAR